MKNEIIHPYSKLDANYVDLRSIFQGLIEYKWLILTSSLMIFMLAMIYASMKPTRYQASILFKIQHKQQNALGTIANQQASLANALGEPLAVQIALIQSEFILRPVIKSLGLDTSITPYRHSLLDYIFGKNISKINISELQVPIEYLKKPLRLVIDDKKYYRLYDQNGRLLIQGNEGKLAGRDDFIAIKIDKINAPVGSQFTLTKEQEFDVIGKIHANLRITDLSGSSENATNKVAILRVSLIGNDPILITNILNQIATITQQQNIKLKAIEAEKNLRILNQQLFSIKKSLEEAETKLNDYRSTTGSLDIQSQIKYLLNHLDDINKKLEVLRLKKSDLLQKYTQNHPTVIDLTRELKELEKYRNQLDKRLKKLPFSEQIIANLKRELTVKNNLYIFLLNQIHQLEIIKGGAISDVQILSKATTPYKLQETKPIVVGFFGLFIGLILGSIGAFGWRIIMQRVDDPNWTENTWNIKNLAIVPYSKEQALNSLAKESGKEKYLSVLAYQSPNDIAVESLCSLRTYLQIAVRSSQNNIIAIMGISKGIGKTFITVNLAYLLARIGKKVLVIDGDIRDGHMNQYFSTMPTPGLTDIMNDTGILKNAIIQLSNLENIDFLPAGTPSEKVADLLTQDSLKSVLASLSMQYQFIFINTPSNTCNSDHLLIGSLAGINLLVLGHRMHEAHEIDVIIKNFYYAGINLNGCIFNNLKRNKNKKYHTRYQLNIEPITRTSTTQY